MVMKKNNVDQYESAIERARKRKANEDELEISSTGYGYVSHGSTPFGTDERNGIEESKNT
jgi:hypothetical protein